MVSLQKLNITWSWHIMVYQVNEKLIQSFQSTKLMAIPCIGHVLCILKKKPYCYCILATVLFAFFELTLASHRLFIQSKMTQETSLSSYWTISNLTSIFQLYLVWVMKLYPRYERYAAWRGLRYLGLGTQRHVLNTVDSPVYLYHLHSLPYCNNAAMQPSHLYSTSSCLLAGHSIQKLALKMRCYWLKMSRPLLRRS